MRNSSLKAVALLCKENSKPAWGSPKGSPQQTPKKSAFGHSNKEQQPQVKSPHRSRIPGVHFRGAEEIESYSIDCAEPVLKYLHPGTMDWHQLSGVKGEELDSYTKAQWIKTLGYPTLEATVQCRAEICCDTAHVGHFLPSKGTVQLVACSIQHLQEVCYKAKCPCKAVHPKIPSEQGEEGSGRFKQDDEMTGNARKEIVSLGMTCRYCRVTPKGVVRNHTCCRKLATFYLPESLSQDRPIPITCGLHQSMYERMNGVTLVESFPLMRYGEGLIDFDQEQPVGADTVQRIIAKPTSSAPVTRRVLILNPAQKESLSKGLVELLLYVEFCVPAWNENHYGCFCREMQSGSFDKELRSRMSEEDLVQLKKVSDCCLRILILKGPKAGRMDVPSETDFIEPLRPNSCLVYGRSVDMCGVANSLAAAWENKLPVGHHQVSPISFNKNNHLQTPDTTRKPNVSSVNTPTTTTAHASSERGYVQRKLHFDSIVEVQLIARKWRKMPRYSTGFVQLFAQIVACMDFAECEHFTHLIRIHKKNVRPDVSFILLQHQYINVYSLRLIFLFMHLNQKEVPWNKKIQHPTIGILNSKGHAVDFLAAPQRVLEELIPVLTKDPVFLAAFVDLGVGEDRKVVENYLKTGDSAFLLLPNENEYPKRTTKNSSTRSSTRLEPGEDYLTHAAAAEHPLISTLWTFARPFHRWVLRNAESVLSLLALLHKTHAQELLREGVKGLDPQELVEKWAGHFGREFYDENQCCLLESDEFWSSRIGNFLQLSKENFSFFKIERALKCKTKELIQFELKIAECLEGDPNFRLAFNGKSDDAIFPAPFSSDEETAATKCLAQSCGQQLTVTKSVEMKKNSTFKLQHDIQPCAVHSQPVSSKASLNSQEVSSETVSSCIMASLHPNLVLTNSINIPLESFACCECNRSVHLMCWLALRSQSEKLLCAGDSCHKTAPSR